MSNRATRDAGETPSAALSRAYSGTGNMRVRVVLHSGAVIEGEAVDGDDTQIELRVGSAANSVVVASADIASVAVRESSRWRMWTFAGAALLAVPMCLAGLLELADVFPTLGGVAFLGLGASVVGAVAARAAVRAWISSVMQEVSTRWRTCYSAPLRT